MKHDLGTIFEKLVDLHFVYKFISSNMSWFPFFFIRVSRLIKKHENPASLKVAKIVPNFPDYGNLDIFYELNFGL